jgi:hypothetical protein
MLRPLGCSAYRPILAARRDRRGHRMRRRKFIALLGGAGPKKPAILVGAAILCFAIVQAEAVEISNASAWLLRLSIAICLVSGAIQCGCLLLDLTDLQQSLSMSAFGGIADIESSYAISLFQSARIMVCRRTWPSAGHGQKRAPAAYPSCHP